LFILMAVALFVGPPVGIVYGIYAAHAQDRDIRSAMPVTAIIISSRVVESRDRHGATTYAPAVVFRYQLAGRDYTSERVMLHAARGQPEGVSAHQFVATHSPGAAVEAYYLPRDPARAFLIKRYDDGPYFLFYVSLAVLAMWLRAE
jgi:hypothetical protein